MPLVQESIVNANYQALGMDEVARDISNIITAVNSLGGSSYNVYTALLTQTGTDAPVATVLENTLGGTVVWSYNSAGNYTGTLLGAFVADKTTILTGQIFANAGDIIYSYTGAPDEVYIETVNAAGTSTNGILGGVVVEIRVYPA